jgi:hypothetical protein
VGYKIFALGVYLDVEGAFDNTSFEAMGKACGVHSTNSRWIAAMLNNLKPLLKLKSTSIRYPMPITNPYMIP